MTETRPLDVSSMDIVADPPQEQAKHEESFVMNVDGEEIWMEDPTPDRVKQVEDEVRTYNLLISKFLSGANKWSLENISARLNGLTHDLYALDKSTSQPLARGYVAAKILPHIAACFANLADKFLPEIHRLDTDQVDQLVVDMGRLLDGERYRDPQLSMINYSDLLDPDASSLMIERHISTDVEDWLVEEAKERLRLLQAEALNPEKDEPPEKVLERNIKINHLTDILKGRFGGGYNTVTEDRWEVITWDFLLNGEVGDVRSAKTISVRGAQYVANLAKDLMADFEYTIKETQGKVLEENTVFKTNYEHIKKYLDTGVLPYDYQVTE